MRRWGLLGGSFDPIHFGHLAIAEEARVSLGLERVLFVPAAQQPLKARGHHAAPEQRLRMVELAIAGNPAFEVRDLELTRAGPSYTVDTLEQLRDELEPAGELYFLMGADALAWLPRWHQPERVLELARLVVFERPGAALDLALVQQALPGLAERLIRLQGPLLDLSSTELRARVAAGRPLRYLVPESVINFIVAQKLYLNKEETP
jgi:nicotinate-nucleotide adenylyltransferase